ncbi:U3 small nucleolar RNA-associated protein 6 protein [Toxoplasma gondii VAND]|uniref:U3 small nucleolar RNA-associated protein 6 protein n=1 Tax=Toxoplasma gondii VAND TaxID=933077 RepID=A0A086Q1R4_TOXGO|nr:U3 small nucleolar RNA-associated protein 6 protein [Toxoplasma gondii VAND]
MADGVQRRLEESLNELESLVSRGLLEEEEAREILRRRRDFEFSCSSRGDPADVVQQFLLYIQYEANLLSLLRHRCSSSLHAILKDLEEVRRTVSQLSLREESERLQAPRKKKRSDLSAASSASSLSAVLQRRRREQSTKEKRAENLKTTLHAVLRAGTNRLYALINRVLHRHSSSLPLWLSCADLLLQLGAGRLLQTFLLQAIRRFPRLAALWILSADRLLQQGNLQGARLLLLQGLRVERESLPLWSDLLRLEGIALVKAAQGVRRARERAREREKDKRRTDEERDLEGAKNGLNTEQGCAFAGEAARQKGEEQEKVEKLHARGRALMVVLQGAVKRLGEEAPRKTKGKDGKGEGRGGRLADNEVLRRAKLQAFLFRALGLCLHLQASQEAGLLAEAIAEFQGKLADLLHAAADEQPLLRLYEWKVHLLRAASERRIPTENKDSSAEKMDAVSRRRMQDLQREIVAECCVDPRLLLLFAFFLGGLCLSSAAAGARRQRGENATEALGPQALAGAERECLGDAVEICFDVDGEEEAQGVEDLLADSVDAEKLVETGEGNVGDAEPASSALALASRAPLQLQKGEDLEKRFFAENGNVELEDGAWGGSLAVALEPEQRTAFLARVYNREARDMLEVLAADGLPEIRLLLKEEPRLPGALLLHCAEDKGLNGEEQTAQPIQKMTALLTAAELAQSQKAVLWTALWREADPSHRLWLLRCMYTAVQQLVEGQPKAGKGKSSWLPSAAVSATGEVLQLLLADEQWADASATREKIEGLRTDLKNLALQAFRKWPSVSLLLLAHHRLSSFSSGEAETASRFSSGLQLSASDFLGLVPQPLQSEEACSRFVSAARSLLRGLAAGETRLRGLESQRLLCALLAEAGEGSRGFQGQERSRGLPDRLPDWIGELLLATRPEATASLVHAFLCFLESSFAAGDWERPRDLLEDTEARHASRKRKCPESEDKQVRKELFEHARQPPLFSWKHAVKALTEDKFCPGLSVPSRLLLVLACCEFSLDRLWASVAEEGGHRGSSLPGLQSTGEVVNSCHRKHKACVALHVNCPASVALEAQAVFECALWSFDRCGVSGGSGDEAGNAFFESKRKLVPHASRADRLEAQAKPLVRQILQVVPQLFDLHRHWWVSFWRFSRFREACNVLPASSVDQRKRRNVAAPLGGARDGHAEISRAALTSPLLSLHREGPATASGAKRSAVASTSVGAGGLESREVERRACVALGVRDSSWLAEEACVPGPEGRGCRVCGSGRLWCMYSSSEGESGGKRD